MAIASLHSEYWEASLKELGSLGMRVEEDAKREGRDLGLGHGTVLLVL